MSLFREVKERSDCIEIATSMLGLPGKMKGTRYETLCPFHADRNPSLVIYRDGFKCFGCGKHGDAIDLVSAVKGLKPLDAALKLAEHYNIPVDKKPKSAKKKRYTDSDLAAGIETWRNEAFDIYVSWYKAIDKTLQRMKITDPYFQALLELKADLGFITDELATGNMCSVFQLYKNIRGGDFDFGL
ncbi:MAG: hypothetical protein GXX00_04380 [Hungateiclostridium thermocellum]|nr:hypothetical protein [Acetivibrio thermocellus]